MPNLKMIFQNAAKIIESLTDNHKNPLHIGEAMACWTYYSFVSEAINIVEIGLNTTSDSKLVKLLQDSHKIMHSHQKELVEVMKQEGIPLPDTPEPKSNADPSAVPLGAKFTDNELINTVNINFVIANGICAAASSESLRIDIALMFIKFQTDKLSLGLKSREVMQDRGWLKIPPPFHSPGAPTNQK